MTACFAANLALGRPTKQYGMWWSLSSDLAVDGNTDPDVENKHCSATFRPRLVPPTCSESSSWWIVDLGYLSAVEKVVIYSRAGSEYKSDSAS